MLEPQRFRLGTKIVLTRLFGGGFINVGSNVLSVICWGYHLQPTRVIFYPTYRD